MTTFPCLVYRAPGSIQRARYSYDAMPMHGQAQLDAKLASGWHMTLEAAIEAAGPLAARHLMGRKSKNPRRTPVKQKPPVERRASMVKAAKKQKPAPVFAPEGLLRLSLMTTHHQLAQSWRQKPPSWRYHSTSARPTRSWPA